MSGVPRFKTRPKLSYDQTIQTEMTSDQTFQTKVNSDQTFPTKMFSDRTFETKMSSYQTKLWPLSWLYCAFGQTQIQTTVQTIKRLWSDFPDQSDRFSDRTQTLVQTIGHLWSIPKSDHCPDYKKTMIRPSGPTWPLSRFNLNQIWKNAQFLCFKIKSKLSNNNHKFLFFDKKFRDFLYSPLFNCNYLSYYNTKYFIWLDIEGWKNQKIDIVLFMIFFHKLSKIWCKVFGGNWNVFYCSMQK